MSTQHRGDLKSITRLDDQTRRTLAARREGLTRLALEHKQAAQRQLSNLQTQIQTPEAEQQKRQQADAIDEPVAAGPLADDTGSGGR